MMFLNLFSFTIFGNWCPFIRGKLNFQISEFNILALSSELVWFTDFCPNEEVRLDLGLIFITHISLFIMANILVLWKERIRY